MAAKIVQRLFDVHQGAVVVTIEDDLGARAVHTIQVLEPDGSEADVTGYIARALGAADGRAEKVRAAFEKHGWTGK
jgi:hypothetical protein